MTLLVIIVYNRIDNIRHWLDCLKKCDPVNTVIIHNCDEQDQEWEELCKDVTYIRRQNVGFDIGAFQDVCRGRLPGFPQWDRLLWCTDDVFPMATDFMKQYEGAHKPGRITAMQISPFVKKHIRTTGFMIDASTAAHLQFTGDPITTKWQCYEFEHRDPRLTFLQQVKGNAIQLTPDKSAPLWDTGYHRRLNRKREHINLFGEYVDSDRVLIICPVFRNYPQIISSMLTQTHENWELLLVHDGPDTDNIAALVPDNKRIKFITTPEHRGKWGHYIRQQYIQSHAHLFDFVVITNADNYHVPTFCEYLLRGFERKPSCVASYCSHMVHSYASWKIVNCRPALGFMDCAGVMVRASVAKEIGWRVIDEPYSDWTYFEDIIKVYGEDKFISVDGVLLIHN